MNIVINEDALAVMEENGILEEDVREVVEYAESVQKMFDEGTGACLGKKRLEAVTVYAEYTVDGDTATVTNVYKHRVTLKEDL